MKSLLECWLLGDTCKGSLVTMLLAFFMFNVFLCGMVALDVYVPPDGTGFESARTHASIHQWLHTLATLSIGVCAMCGVDLILLPWLSIKDVVTGKICITKSVTEPIRCALIVGWFILAASILLSVTQGVIAL